MRKLEDFEENQRENPKGISAADKQREPSRIAISSTKLHATERVERALPSLPTSRKPAFPMLRPSACSTGLKPLRGSGPALRVGDPPSGFLLVPRSPGPRRTGRGRARPALPPIRKER